MSDRAVRFTVVETERGWIVRVEIASASRRIEGPASFYPFPSAGAAWAWVREQFDVDVREGDPGDVDGSDGGEAKRWA